MSIQDVISTPVPCDWIADTTETDTSTRTTTEVSVCVRVDVRQATMCLDAQVGETCTHGAYRLTPGRSPAYILRAALTRTLLQAAPMDMAVIKLAYIQDGRVRSAVSEEVVWQLMSADFLGRFDVPTGRRGLVDALAKCQYREYAVWSPQRSRQEVGV